MISTGLVNAIAQWATGNAVRIAQLVEERDALIAGSIITGGKPGVTLNSVSVNGKTFGAEVNISADEKLSLLTAVLEQLGEIEAQPRRVVHANFSLLQR